MNTEQARLLSDGSNTTALSHTQRQRSRPRLVWWENIPETAGPQPAKHLTRSLRKGQGHSLELTRRVEP